MKKGFAIVILAVISIGCSKGVTPADIVKINGYWEIENVVLPDGIQKEYKISETIDYFEFEATDGFRQKVKPQFTGRYVLDTKAEKVEAVFKADKAYLKYATDYAEWKEEILEISDQTLILKNSNGLIYHYKKPVLFTIK